MRRLEVRDSQRRLERFSLRVDVAPKEETKRGKEEEWVVSKQQPCRRVARFRSKRYVNGTCFSASIGVVRQ